VAVDYSTFFRVATAIESGQIMIDHNTNSLLPGAGAEYHPDNNEVPFYRSGRSSSGVIVISKNDDPITQAKLIHESVHASFDLTYSDFPALENEAAAYLAGALFLKTIDFNFWFPNDLNGRLCNMSWAILNRNPGVRVIPTSEITCLIDLLEVDPLYRTRRHLHYLSNG
jgi:hypothetical protein